MAKRPQAALPKIFTGAHHRPVDAKGRISVPPDFRARLDDPAEGLYAMRSLAGVPCLDVFEPRRFALLVENFEQVFAPEVLDRAFTIFGASLHLKLDPEGRITLPEDERAYAGIRENACFFGLGQRFQIWDPEQGRLRQEEAFRNVRPESIVLPPADGSRGRS